MKIIVTQENIDCANQMRSDRGSQFSLSHHCPIALAIEMELPNADVTVQTTVCSINGTAIGLPPYACSFTRDFDNGLPVSPFEFELNTKP